MGAHRIAIAGNVSGIRRACTKGPSRSFQIGRQVFAVVQARA
jgi:hypothetical protein